MKSFRLMPTVMSVTLVCALAGCFGPKKSTSSREEHERREKKEQAERRKHLKKGEVQRVDRSKKFGGGEEEEDGDERYDGIVAAQQREYDMTHDLATNTIPKERLVKALAQRNLSIAQQQNNLLIKNGISTTYGMTYSIDATSWVERGPYKDYAGPYGNPRDSISSTSGRIVALCIDNDPTRPNQVFVGGIDGGLWSCPDITANAPAWTFIDNFSNLAISSICQDPTNPNIMYFGTGEHTINSDAVRGGGIWKSTDHGVSWTFLTNTATFYNVSKILCDKNGYVYVSTTFSSGIGTGSGLQRSLNGGSSWTDITPAVGGLTTRQVGDMVYDPSTDKIGVYMGYYPNNIAILTGFCYTNSPSTVTTSTWTQSTTSATAGGGMLIKANTSTTQLYQTILTVKNGVFWALRSDYGTVAMYLYRSTDGGVTWTQQGSALSNSIYGAGQGWYSIGMDCDPLNPTNNVMIGGLNVFKSTNGGTSFAQVSEWVTGANTGAPAQYVHADVHNIYYNTNASGQNRALVVCDGGIFYSNNGGINWADRNIGLRIKQFYSCAINPSVPDYYLAGAQDNGSHQFTQPGLGQSTEVNGGDGAIVAIDQLNPENQITSYVYNSYHVSKDGGKTWSSNTFGSSVGQFINPFDFDSKTKKMYAAYSAGNYLRWDDPTTTQSTSSVVSISSVITTIPTAVTVSSNLANTIYVAGGSRLAKVANAQTNAPTVTAITPPSLTGNISSIVLGPSATDQDILVTVSTYGAKKVFVTADGGTTWTEITGNLPDMPVRWSLFYPGTNTKVYLATEAGIWYTNAINGAATVWQASPGFPAVRSDMIKYAATNGTIAVGTHGRGLWTTKYSTVPKVSFYSTLLNTSKSVGTATTGCRTYADYSDTIQISDAPTGTANVTIAVQPGSTAKQGVDFDFTTNGSFISPSTVATFVNGTYPNKIPVTVRIYNNHDRNAALPLTLTLGYTISGSTDAITSPTNQTLAINLTDVFPSLVDLANQPLWSENWESWPATFNSWSFVPEAYYGSPANANALIPLGNYGCAGPISGVTAQLFGMDANGNLALCANGNAGAYTARMSRAVNAGTNHNANMKVSFSYKSNGNNTTITNSLVYSIDGGTTWVPIASYTSTGATTAIATTTATIPASLNNVNYLLGWQSVGTAAATYSANGWEIDNIVVTGDVPAAPIDSTMGSIATNYETTGQNIDFYSANSNILGNITNSSADLGCVSISLENAGNIWQPFAGGSRSQKSFLITPTTGSTATYNTTLYFTYAELAGMNPTTLKLAKTTASSAALANASNTILVSPTTATYSTNGVSFTGTFTGFSRFFLTDANVLFPIAFTGCPNLNLAIARPGYNVYNGEPTSIYNIDTATGATTLLPGGPLKDFTGKRNIDVNGAGVNAQDGFVYAIRDTINTNGTAASAMLYRIGSNYGNYTVGTLPAPAILGSENLAVVNPAAGSFDGQGNYYYIGMAGAYSFTSNSFTPSSYYIGKIANVASLTGGTTTLFPTWTKIDFSGVACGNYKSSAFSTISSASGAGAGTSFQDIAYSNLYRSLYVYAAYPSGGSYVGQLLAINPNTGVATCYAPTIPFGAANNEVAGISTTNSGSLRVFMTGGDIYKTNVLPDGSFTGSFTKIGASGITPLGVTGSIRGDLASCGVGSTSLPSTSLPSSIAIGAPDQIIAYPNPAPGITTVTVGQALTNATVRMLGISGNVISEKSGVSGYSFNMDMTGKPAGMYVIEVIQAGNVQKVKVIKK